MYCAHFGTVLLLRKYIILMYYTNYVEISHQFCGYIALFLSMHYNCMSRCYTNNIDALVQLHMSIFYSIYVDYYANYVDLLHQLCRCITPIMSMHCTNYVDELHKLCRCIMLIMSLYYNNYVDAFYQLY